MIKNNFLESIGNTQLIKLKMASEITGCNIYGKAEYQNPGCLLYTSDAADE